MKWLRSSLFKNGEQFIFEKKLDINIKNLPKSVYDIKDISIKAILTKNGENKILVDINIKGTYYVYSSRTLNIIPFDFNIDEKEEFVDRKFLQDDNYFSDISEMDMYIDISDLIREILIVNVPNNYFLEEEKLYNIKGKDWKLMTEEEHVNKDLENNPFSTLKDVFKSDI